MFDPIFKTQASTKQLDTSNKQLDMSTKQYNLNNWKATTKQLCVWININKLLLRMALRANRRL